MTVSNATTRRSGLIDSSESSVFGPNVPRAQNAPANITSTATAARPAINHHRRAPNAACVVRLPSLAMAKAYHEFRTLWVVEHRTLLPALTLACRGHIFAALPQR
jgi:hypothetical protein